MDVLCVRAADFDRHRLRVSPERLPVRSVASRVARELSLRPGDLVLEKSGGGADQPVGGVALFDLPVRAVCSNFAARLRPAPGVQPRYLNYLLASMYYAGVTDALGKQTTGIANLDTGAFLAASCDVPGTTAQRAIADYLDAETARIDALVEARRETAALVSLRLEVITRVRVTIGGEGQSFPVLPLRRGWQVVDCKHRTPVYQPDGFPIVSPGDATPGRLDLSRCTRFVDRADCDDLAEGSRRPRRGDIIYTRNASIGIASYVDTDQEFSMGQDVCLIRSTDQDQRYLTYVLNTLGLDQLEEQKIGSTFSRINVARVLELLVPCPPAAEQKRIAEDLDDATIAVGHYLSASGRQIDLLLERRQALITAAVTGHLEIPGVAA